MERNLKIKFLGQDVEIPITYDDGGLVFDTWDDSPFEIKLPHGFTWTVEFELDSREMENNRSIIKNEYGDIVSVYTERYIDPDDPVNDFEALIKESFNNFDKDIKKKLEEAIRTIPLYEEIIKIL